MDKTFKKRHFSSFQIIIFGFIFVILAGTAFLMLPFASKSGLATPFSEALFTATSAVCVTGLVVQDTATYWSSFGQAIILILIQIGGLGVITVGACIVAFSGKKISLMQRSTMQEAICAQQVGGIVRLTYFVLKGTLLIETIGALVMMPVFVKDFGANGIWMSVFHSVSAFCNAGFDLLGTLDAKYASLTAYSRNPVITITIMLLIILGGIGFLTWEDICIHKHHIKKYRMQTKVILTAAACLITIPAVIFFFFEYSSLAMDERILSSLFQSVTTRTAGFNTTDLTQLTDSGKSIMTVLMLIGGSPGSTAGGMKTTTFVVLLANALCSFRRMEDPQLFGRRLDASIVKNAATIMSMYMVLFFTAGLCISTIEMQPLGNCLFETASAVGTVGLTLGLTPTLSMASRYILIALMYLGRVGGLTLIYATVAGARKNLYRLPQGKITVG